jgi:methylmalonyl-CoA mutase cobalamin-binding subunit
MPEPVILAAAMGDCVHVTGMLNFLALARRHGYRTEFLGPAVSVTEIVQATGRIHPDILALSYRLSPEAASRLFIELRRSLHEAGVGPLRMIFGGTPPVAEVARSTGLFEAVFGGGDGPSAEEYLRGGPRLSRVQEVAWDLVGRRRQVFPRPLLRHHFGLPGLQKTAAGVAAIAEAQVVDVISLGLDQNAQEHFFHPQRMDPAQDGAGGVPVRSVDDLRLLAEAARRGNHPLMRCYSGTNDLVRFGRVLQETIGNAWCVVPVFWYSELDGRSRRPLAEAIAENQALVAWSTSQGIPVERNDQNQWGLRAAHDTVQVASAALAARLSATAGVTTYVLQMMLNNPSGIAPAMDVAKMEAMYDLVSEAVGEEVTVLRELRAGLFSMPPDPERARGQLASSTRTAMLLAPDILHVVGFSEAHHAVEAEELIASCSLVHQVIDDALLGLPDPLADADVRARRDWLLHEARYLLRAIEDRFPAVRTGDREALAAVVERGFFDAPHLVSNPVARGEVITFVDGGCDAADPRTGAVLTERARIRLLDGSQQALGYRSDRDQGTFAPSVGRSPDRR